MNKIEIGGYSRISKAKAEKLYNDYQTIYLCPVKMSPVNMWTGAMQARKDCTVNGYTDREETFNQLYNAFSYYNCNNETGKYIAFYVKENTK